MSGTNLAANNPAYLQLLRERMAASPVAPTDGLTPAQTRQAVTGNYGNYGTDMPTGQPYGTDVSPYANVPAPASPQAPVRTGGPRVVSPNQQAARPERRPGSPPSTPAPAVPEDQAGADPLSPRTLIYNYLREKGMPLTSANVRRALEANAANRGVIGGTGRDDAYSNAEMPVHLINDVAGTDPKTSAAPGSGTRRLPTPPVPPKLGDEQGPPRPELDQPSLPNQGMEPNNVLDIARQVLGRFSLAPQPLRNYQLEVNPSEPQARIGGPPEQPRIEGPGGGARVGGPPEVPRLPPPAAIPMPQVPAATTVPANPPVPPVAMDRALEPARQPRVTVQQVPTEQLRAPPISPQNPVIQTPGAKAVGNIGAGIAAGAARGGPRGAVVGGAKALAEEVGPPVLDALKRRAATRKPPSPRPRKKADDKE